MKQLSSFMVMSLDGGKRVSYTYDEINSDTGEIISQNNKKNFFAVDPYFVKMIEDVENYIKENKLQ